jgi:hypothetical protein
MLKVVPGYALTATRPAAAGHRPNVPTHARRHISQVPLFAARVARRLERGLGRAYRQSFFTFGLMYFKILFTRFISQPAIVRMFL